MPIDNATLLRHTPPPPERRSRPWWVAPLVFLLGAAVFAVAFKLALGDPFRTRIVVIALVTYAALFGLWRMYLGWQDDGLFGLWYSSKHDMGTVLAGDEERDGLAIALWILAGLAMFLSIALGVVTPSAFTRTPPPAPGVVSPSSP